MQPPDDVEEELVLDELLEPLFDELELEELLEPLLDELELEELLELLLEEPVLDELLELLLEELVLDELLEPLLEELVLDELLEPLLEEEEPLDDELELPGASTPPEELELLLEEPVSTVTPPQAVNRATLPAKSNGRVSRRYMSRLNITSVL